MFSRIALFACSLAAIFFLPVMAHADSIAVSPTSVEITAGKTALVQVKNASGTVTATTSNPAIATASYASSQVTIKGIAAGSAIVTVKDRRSSAKVEVKVLASSSTSGGTTGSGGYAVVAWNDLGMHCVDGSDYSIFSILPPFNNLHAHLVDKTTGKKVTSGVTLTYESVADSTGSINTISSTKTNFWQYVQNLFGANPAPDIGLTGNAMSSTIPKAMKLDAASQEFVADGIPITPVDDSRRKNFYPMVKVVAKNSSGTVLATTKTVLPVSDELNCAACHTSTSSTSTLANAAKPSSGWVFDAMTERDWKKNILKLHDEKQMSSATFKNALTSKGYRSTGLYDTATNGLPVLCSACHGSNALPGTGIAGIKPLTEALHGNHAKVVDPATNLTLDASSNRTACYLCHPGAVTQCLRGAMGKAVDASGNPLMSCQSCHSNMSTVGAAGRQGWLEEPNCQSCHHDGKRESAAVNAAGTLYAWTDTRFATTPNTPVTGTSLYRMSKGHGGLNCESCHGATHAIYPTSEVNDNVQSIALQGHTGTIAECTACHATVPLTQNGGPHGMHTIGQQWVSSHGDIVESSGASSCTYCHGADYKGGFLSQVKTNKTFSIEGGSKSFTAGQALGCYDCHNGPNP